MPQKDAVDARSKVRSPADWERINVERSLLQPGRVVGDECERAEMDLAALNQTPPETMMMGIGKIATSPISR